MNIAISIDSKYVMPAIVMLTSLFENNKFENIRVYILYSHLNKKDKFKIINHISRYKQKVFFKKVNSNIFKDFPMGGQFKEENYYRLLIWEAFPSTLERILYLDTDIIVKGCLERFYYQNLDDYYFIVCEDTGNASRTRHKKQILSLKMKYFNSGVMIYNLKISNKLIIRKNIFEYVKKNRNKIFYADQDILNALFYNKVKFVDCKVYNFLVATIKGKKFNTKKTKIFHYAGIKPWNYKYIGKLDNLFWRYAWKAGYKLEYFKYKVLNSIYRIIQQVIN